MCFDTNDRHVCVHTILDLIHMIVIAYPYFEHILGIILARVRNLFGHVQDLCGTYSTRVVSVSVTSFLLVFRTCSAWAERVFGKYWVLCSVRVFYVLRTFSARVRHVLVVCSVSVGKYARARYVFGIVLRASGMYLTPVRHAFHTDGINSVGRYSILVINDQKGRNRFGFQSGLLDFSQVFSLAFWFFGVSIFRPSDFFAIWFFFLLLFRRYDFATLWFFGLLIFRRFKFLLLIFRWYDFFGLLIFQWYNFWPVWFFGLLAFRAFDISALWFFRSFDFWPYFIGIIFSDIFFRPYFSSFGFSDFWFSDLR